ncbi:hypothetical protein [Streptomyces sp. NPDC059063]|uniref:hypothetical protein n=1 Tax=unclassified Streptomyces TaxID=2593676 RepID=UPI0036CA4659
MTVWQCSRNNSHEGDAVAGSLLCAHCIGQAEATLRVLPALHQECLHHTAPAPRRSNPTRVSGSRTLDQVNIAVLEARSRLLAALEAWSDTVAAGRGIAVPARSVPRLAAFLAEHLRWLAAQPCAADFVDETERLAAELRAAIDPASGELRTAIRKCVVDRCGGVITTPLNSGGRPPADRLECSMGHVWEIREWLKLRSLMEQQRTGAGS